MGALHAGHLSLVEAAQARSDETVVSIFVNPTQFRPGEDFDRYPRPHDEDLAKCEAAGVDYVFMPSVERMYPRGQDAVRIHVGSVGDRWEGEARPGHFDGVATVVTQLMLMVRPSLAVFSVKDLQQCAVIEKLLTSLELGVELHLAPTLREPDGLAMSSRNRYLSPGARAVAPQLYQALTMAKERLASSKESDASNRLKEAASTLDSMFDLQYFSVVNRVSMEPAPPSEDDAWLMTAARLDGTRLIDNICLHG